MNEIPKKKNVLICVETSRAYGRGIIKGITRYLTENDHWYVHIEDRGLFENQHAIKTWQGDGIITRSPSLSHAEVLARKNVPLVELLGDGINVISEVRSDENIAAQIAFDHFKACQLTNFAFFAVGNAWWSNLRGEHFQAILEKAGYPMHVFPKYLAGKPCIYPDWYVQYDEILPEWLKSLPKPVGLWAVNDFSATRVLEACFQCGIHVPEEIALLGTGNDSLLCNIHKPAISSIDLNSFQVGYDAARLLDMKIFHSKDLPDKTIEIAPSGVVLRQSTDMIVVPDPDMTEALRFIRENGIHGLSVEDVANHVNLSMSTLERYFRKYLGRSPAKEILRIRIQRAKVLLLESDLSISTIASRTGFATVEYFTQVFRRETNHTPYRFRTLFQRSD